MAVPVVLAVAILHQATDVIGTVERRFYDFASTRSDRRPSDRIAVTLNGASLPPGYDEIQKKTDAVDPGAFARTVIRRPAEPRAPVSGDDETDLKA